MARWLKPIERFHMISLKLRMSAVALGAGAIIALAVPTGASAHDSLESSTPSEGETLTALPAEFSVTSSEDLLAIEGSTAGFALRIVDSAGLYYGDGCVTISGATLSAASALGDPGEYSLEWQVVGSDGHPVSGEVGFTWSPSDPFESAVGSGEPPTCEQTDVTGPTSESPTDDAHSEDELAHAEDGDPSQGALVGGAITAALVAGIIAYLVIRGRSKKA